MLQNKKFALLKVLDIKNQDYSNVPRRVAAQRLATIAVSSIPSTVESRRIDAVGYLLTSALFTLAQGRRRSGARHGLGVVADDGEHHRLLRSLSHCLRRC